MKEDGKLNVINHTLNKVFGQRCDVLKKFAETSKNFASNLNSKLIFYIYIYVIYILYIIYVFYYLYYIIYLLYLSHIYIYILQYDIYLLKNK